MRAHAATPRRARRGPWLTPRPGSVADDAAAGKVSEDTIREGCRRRPTPGCGSGVRLARYLQQVQLGYQAPRQMEEAVPNVREGHRHDRPSRPRTGYAIAAPHRLH